MFDHIEQIFEEGQVNRLPWPVKSPHQNPIKNLWDQLCRAVHSRNNQCNNILQEMITA